VGVAELRVCMLYLITEALNALNKYAVRNNKVIKSSNQSVLLVLLCHFVTQIYIRSFHHLFHDAVMNTSYVCMYIPVTPARYFFIILVQEKMYFKCTNTITIRWCIARQQPTD